jgi:hypothetical protein
MTTEQSKLTSRLKRIQSELGLEADGLLGPETLTALELKLGIVATARTVSLECSRMSLDLLLGFEVGSRQRYERDFQRPVWPGGQSGVTIGIGYDLGVTRKADIRADWEPLLAEADLVALLAVQGVTGPAAKRLALGISQVVIPLAPAEHVFYTRTLPAFAARTRETFAGVQKLPADAQGMLLSLVYNRGASVAGPRRVEMANLQRLLRGKTPKLEALASEFESMKRLWPDLPGLQKRRQREAEVLRAARRVYARDEIVRV